MSLTLNGSPLATPGPRDVNYSLDGPGHRLYLHPFPRRVRALVGGDTVLDSTRALLLDESNLLPQLYVPRDDVRMDLLAPTDHTTHCPFKGDAGYWTVSAGGQERENAFWGYPDPLVPWLDGLVAPYFDRLDAWYDEDVEVRGHLRDPFHRVDVRPSSRHVRVTVGGEEIADSTRALLVSETGLDNRWYLPRADVLATLDATDTTTHCPYKGDASYFTVAGVDDAAWTYPEPLDGCTALKDHLSFDGEGIAVDEV